MILLDKMPSATPASRTCRHSELVAQLAEPEVHRIVERLFFIEVTSFDWNCPKHITPRYKAAEVEEAVEPLRQRIAELEAQLKAQTRLFNGFWVAVSG